jgi:hypothetical protein
LVHGILTLYPPLLVKNKGEKAETLKGQVYS